MPYGQNGTIAVNFQNSFGTSLTTSPFFLPIVNENIALKKEPLVSQEMRGIYDEGGTREGKNLIDGEVMIDVDMTSLAVMLKAVMGSPVTVSSDDLRTMTYKPRTTDFDTFAANIPMTIDKYLDDSGSAQLFYDLVGSSLEFSVANGEFYKAKFTVMGGKYSQTANTAASYPTDSKLTWDVGSFSLGGAANSDLLDINIVLDEVLEPIYVINGTKTPSYIKRSAFRTIRVDGTMLFNDQTELDKFVAQSEEAMSFYLADSTATEVQSGYQQSVLVELPAYRYETFEPTLSGPGQLQVGFSAQGKYLTTSATALAITLTNTFQTL